MADTIQTTFRCGENTHKNIEINKFNGKWLENITIDRADVFEIIPHRNTVGGNTFTCSEICLRNGDRIISSMSMAKLIQLITE